MCFGKNSKTQLRGYKDFGGGQILDFFYTLVENLYLGINFYLGYSLSCAPIKCTVLHAFLHHTSYQNFVHNFILSDSQCLDPRSIIKS